jgi:hypothetical protein
MSFETVKRRMGWKQALLGTPPAPPVQEAESKKTADLAKTVAASHADVHGDSVISSEPLMEISPSM